MQDAQAILVGAFPVVLDNVRAVCHEVGGDDRRLDKRTFEDTDYLGLILFVISRDFREELPDANEQTENRGVIKRKDGRIPLDVLNSGEAVIEACNIFAESQRKPVELFQRLKGFADVAFIVFVSNGANFVHGAIISAQSGAGRMGISGRVRRRRTGL